MSVKDIRLFGDPVLRTPAQEVETYDKELRRLVQDLTDTMLDASGAGLAAPQLGVGLRVFTWCVDNEVGHLVNPSLDLSEDIQEGEEGCLSIPGVYVDTKRSYGVVAKGWNMHGDPVTIEGTELLSRAIQHETDHLDGILFFLHSLCPLPFFGCSWMIILVEVECEYGVRWVRFGMTVS